MATMSGQLTCLSQANCEIIGACFVNKTTSKSSQVLLTTKRSAILLSVSVVCKYVTWNIACCWPCHGRIDNTAKFGNLVVSYIEHIPSTGDQCSQLIVATLVPSTPICLFFNLAKLQCKQTVVTDFCIGFVNKIHIIGKGYTCSLG